MNLMELRTRLRARLRDELLPPLWPDETLNAHLNDALREAVIRADLTVECNIRIPIVVGVTQYLFPVEVLLVRSVRLESLPDFELAKTSLRRQIDRHEARGGRTTEKPSRYVLDQTLGVTRAVTLLDTPSKVDALLVDVVRRAAELIDDTDEPEIDSLWHLDLLDWAEWLAYNEPYADAQYGKLALMRRQSFEEKFGIRLPACVIRERQTDVPIEIIVE